MGAIDENKQKDIKLLTEDLPVLPFDESVSKKAAEIYHQLRLENNMMDEDVFSDNVTENNKFNILTDAELRQYNCYQSIWAYDEVYSSKNDFKLIEYLKTANGDFNQEIFLERPTIEVYGK